MREDMTDHGMSSSGESSHHTREARVNDISESEGDGISDAPTAVVSDTEGHGQVITNVRSEILQNITRQSNLSSCEEDDLIPSSQTERSQSNQDCQVPATICDDEDIVNTPSTHIASLQLSGQPMLIQDSEENMSDGYIPQTMDVYSTPHIIPGSPTSDVQLDILNELSQQKASKSSCSGSLSGTNTTVIEAKQPRDSSDDRSNGNDIPFESYEQGQVRISSYGSSESSKERTKKNETIDIQRDANVTQVSSSQKEELTGIINSSEDEDDGQLILLLSPTQKNKEDEPDGNSSPNTVKGGQSHKGNSSQAKRLKVGSSGKTSSQSELKEGDDKLPSLHSHSRKGRRNVVHGKTGDDSPPSGKSYESSRKKTVQSLDHRMDLSTPRMGHSLDLAEIGARSQDGSSTPIPQLHLEGPTLAAESQTNSQDINQTVFRRARIQAREKEIAIRRGINESSESTESEAEDGNKKRGSESYRLFRELKRKRQIRNDNSQDSARQLREPDILEDNAEEQGLDLDLGPENTLDGEEATRPYTSDNFTHLKLKASEEDNNNSKTPLVVSTKSAVKPQQVKRKASPLKERSLRNIIMSSSDEADTAVVQTNKRQKVFVEQTDHRPLHVQSQEVFSKLEYPDTKLRPNSEPLGGSYVFADSPQHMKYIEDVRRMKGLAKQRQEILRVEEEERMNSSPLGNAPENILLTTPTTSKGPPIQTSTPTDADDAGKDQNTYSQQHQQQQKHSQSRMQRIPTQQHSSQPSKGSSGNRDGNHQVPIIPGKSYRTIRIVSILKRTQIIHEERQGGITIKTQSEEKTETLSTDITYDDDVQSTPSPSRTTQSLSSGDLADISSSVSMKSTSGYKSASPSEIDQSVISLRRISSIAVDPSIVRRSTIGLDTMLDSHHPAHSTRLSFEPQLAQAQIIEMEQSDPAKKTGNESSLSKSKSSEASSLKQSEVLFSSHSEKGDSLQKTHSTNSSRSLAQSASLFGTSYERTSFESTSTDRSKDDVAWKVPIGPAMTSVKFGKPLSHVLQDLTDDDESTLKHLTPNKTPGKSLDEDKTPVVQHSSLARVGDLPAQEAEEEEGVKEAGQDAQDLPDEENIESEEKITTKVSEVDADSKLKTRSGRKKREPKKEKKTPGPKTKKIPVEQETDSMQVLAQVPTEENVEKDDTNIDEEEKNKKLPKGTPVYAKWNDNFFYPGHIHSYKSSQYKIRFEDGDLNMAKESDILNCDLLEAGSTILAARKAGGWSEPAIILETVVEDKFKGYVVNFNDDTTARVPRKDTQMSIDQSMSVGHHSLAAGALLSPLHKADVSLDNLVDGKRPRSQPGSAVRLDTERRSTRKSTTKKVAKSLVHSAKGSTSKATPKNVPSESKAIAIKDSPSVISASLDDYAASRKKGAKRKLIPESTPKSGGTPTPSKAKKNLCAAAPVPYQDENFSPLVGCVDSPKTQGKRTSGKKSKSDGILLGNKGPIPDSNVFQGIIFMLTHVGKQQTVQKKNNSTTDVSTDDSSVMDENEAPAFDKDHLQKQIENGGGVLLEKFDEKLIAAARQCYLISDASQRTLKYLLCLASNIPCVSHVWIRDCCQAGRLLDCKSYMLPAGFSIKDGKDIECIPGTNSLQTLTMTVLGEDRRFRDSWMAVLRAAGAKIIHKISIRTIRSGSSGLDYAIADPSLPANYIEAFREENIPIVSSEWLVQCLITKRLPNPSDSIKYKHDYPANV